MWDQGWVRRQASDPDSKNCQTCWSNTFRSGAFTACWHNIQSNELILIEQGGLNRFFFVFAARDKALALAYLVVNFCRERK